MSSDTSRKKDPDPRAVKQVVGAQDNRSGSSGQRTTFNNADACVAEL